MVHDVGAHWLVVSWLPSSVHASACTVRSTALHLDEQALWLDGLVGIGEAVGPKERGELLELMRERELRVRTDTYEILLAAVDQQRLLDES